MQGRYLPIQKPPTVEGNTGKIVPLSLVKKEIQQAKTLV